MSAAYCGGFDFSGGQHGLQKGRKNIAAGGGGTDTAISGRRIYLYTKERRKQEMLGRIHGFTPGNGGKEPPAL